MRHAIGSARAEPTRLLAERVAERPSDRPLLLYCTAGYRSSIAANVLQARGFTTVSETAGGIAGWEAAMPGCLEP